MASNRRLKSYPATALPHRSFRTADDGKGGWELAICGDLTERQSELIGKLIEVPRNSRGTLFFDSCGGSPYVGLGLASLIRLRGLKADGVVTGECSSAALLPFSVCTRRFVTAHSTLLFHQGRWQSEDSVRHEEAAEWARHFGEMEKDLDGLLERMFGISKEKLATWTTPGRFVTGSEMAEAGLANLVDLYSGNVWEQMEQASAESRQ